MKRFVSFTLAMTLLIFSLITLSSSLCKTDMVTEAYIEDLGNKSTQQQDYLSDEFSISVCGEATKSVKPDFAKIYVAIETLDMDVEQAKNINFEKFDKILKGLSDLGFSKDDIILESFTSYPNYDYASGKTLTGYYFTTSFSVKVDDLENIKNVIDDMTSNGVSSIKNINYQVSNLDDVYDQVLIEALENAKTKAKKLTNQDLTIKSIKEETVYSSTSLYKTYAESIQNNDLIGQLDIKAKVIVTFS